MSKVMLNRLIPLWDGLACTAQGFGCATARDRKDFARRALSEGLPFLSDGLAGLGKVFLLGLRKGFLVKEDFSSVRFELKEGSTLPLFLYSAWSAIFTDDGRCIGGRFDDHSGVLLSWTPPIAATVAVRWLRQLTVVFSKLHLPHDESRVTEVFDRFRANEDYLASVKGVLWDTQYANKTRFPYQGETTQRLTDVLLRARRLLHKILCNVDPRDIVPRHGSGASASRTRPWERYDRILFDPVQNTLWPWLEFASAGRDHTDQLLSTEFITDGYPKCARGVFVPKDYRGPRLISCEPDTSMYYQQGLMTKLVTHLETSPITSGFVNFTDQTVNQVLARKGSIDRKTATLDLKDASDLLSWDLVVLLWPDHWHRALAAVRSKCTEIDVPGKGPMKVPLRKHAPMGSAVCFPVMALTIWALIKTAQFSAGRAQAWIYGDDIVCASRDADLVCDMLESVHLKVNRDKSFIGATPFRESCGKEYWDGSDTTPVYCRYNPETNDTAIASLCSFANNMALNKGVYASDNITQLVHQMTGVPIVGIPDDRNVPLHSDSDVWMLPEYGAYFRPNEGYRGSGTNPIPHLLFGPSYLCQRSTIPSKRAVNSREGTDFQKKVYRIRRPYPVNQAVDPKTWGYVLRSSLIGGDLGFAMSTALAKRVVYKYGWVALDW
jgi:hypothetical protein